MDKVASRDGGASKGVQVVHAEGRCDIGCGQIRHSDVSGEVGKDEEALFCDWNPVFTSWYLLFLSRFR